ncbi:MAG: hypothetical protein JXR97_05535 [Planctomycetes bacterium]|nr:hypothetical protein [Planctomycetota bacterium]
MGKGRTLVAGTLMFVTAGMLGAVIYLAFVFPKTIAEWENVGKELSVVEKLLAHSSQICSSLGIVLLPLLGLCFIGSLAWLVASAIKTSAGADE